MSDPDPNKIDGIMPRVATEPTDVAQPHPKQEEAMRLFEKVQRNRSLGIGIDIKSVASQLKSPRGVQQFPEPLFVEKFLPLFAREIEPTAALNYNTWIEKVAGGETMPVDIVNPETGEVLFTVPPMFDTSILDTKAESSASMTRIERQYSRLREVDAAGSQLYLHRALSTSHIKEEPTPEVLQNMKVWDEIFQRYGRGDQIIKLLDTSNVEVPQGKSPGSQDPDNGFGEYELDTD